MSELYVASIGSQNSISFLIAIVLLMTACEANESRAEEPQLTPAVLPSIKYDPNYLPDNVPPELTPSEYYRLAERYAELNRFGEALFCVDQIYKLNPDGEISDKARVFRETRLPKHLPTKDIQSKFLRALQLKADDRNQVNLLHECIQDDPSFESPYLVLATKYSFENRAQSKTLYKKVLYLNPQNAEALHCLADIAMAEKNTKMATQYLREALRNDPCDHFSITNLSYLQNQKISRAVPDVIEYIKRTSKWGLIDQSGQYVFKAGVECQGFHQASKDLLAVKYHTFQFTDFHGKRAFEGDYNGVRSFSEHLCAVEVDSKWGFINDTGTVSINPIYDAVRDFSEGLAPAKIGSDWGFIDHGGAFVIPPKFDGVLPFAEGLAATKAGGKIGYIDKGGNLVIPAIYDYGYSFSEGLALVARLEGPTQRHHLQFIDKNGNVIIEVTKLQLCGDGEGIIFGALPNSSDVVLSARNENDPGGSSNIKMQFDEGLYPLRLGKYYGYINRKGEVAIEPKFNYALPFCEGFARVESVQENKERSCFPSHTNGFIRDNGRFIITPRFEEVADFSDGLAAVKAKNRWGFIDKSGKLIIPEKFDRVGNFKNGVAPVGYPAEF